MRQIQSKPCRECKKKINARGRPHELSPQPSFWQWSLRPVLLPATKQRLEHSNFAANEMIWPWVKSRTPSEHPNPHQNRLKWVVQLPQNGTQNGFDNHGHLRRCLLDVFHLREHGLDPEDQNLDEPLPSKKVARCRFRQVPRASMRVRIEHSSGARRPSPWWSAPAPL